MGAFGQSSTWSVHGPTPLVGRDAELSHLEAALLRVRTQKNSQIVTIFGGTGIGKTRLARDFLTKQREGGKEVLRVFRGSVRDSGVPYGVFGRVLRARFGIVEGMDAEAAKAQVRAQVATVLEDRKVGDVLYFLGQLLDLEFMDSPLIEAVRSEPQQMRFLRRAVIKRFLEADAKSAALTKFPSEPVTTTVLVFDDLHAAHDDSLELLATLLESLDAPLLILCLARPELFARRDEWRRLGGLRHTAIELGTLSESDAAKAMRALLAPVSESPAIEELVDSACAFANGTPALLEQMLRIFRELGVIEIEEALVGDEKWRVHVEKLAQVSLPLTVEDAVKARLGALSPAERELLERAATMGGVFWAGGLLAISRLDSEAPPVWTASTNADSSRLRAMLKELTERDYILRLPDSSFPGDDEYVFKHNLEREALLNLLPKGAKKRYHRAIADWLSFKDAVRSSDEYTAMMARHLELSDSPAQAMLAYLAAANVARDQYANAKAVEYYGKGLALIRGGAEVDADVRLRTYHHYGDVLQVLGKNDEALQAFVAMQALAFKLDLPSKGGAAHSRIGRLYRDTGRLDEAGVHLETALNLFEQSVDERGIASTVDDLGKLQWLRGDYQKALEFTQRALSMRRKIGDRRSIGLSLNNLGLVYQDSGQFKLALDSFEQALRIRREIGDLIGVSITLNNLGTVAQDQRDNEKALTLFQEALEVARETGDRNRIALVLTNLGETYNRLGDSEQAIWYLKQAEEIADELGDKLGLAEAVRGLGKAYLAQKEFAKARECVSRAIEVFRALHSKVQLGTALRALAEVLASGGAGGERQQELLEARAHAMQSVWIFEEIGNDIELAKSCRVCAKLLKEAPEAATDAKLREEAEGFARRADEIFAKLRLSSSGIDADTFFGS